MNLSPPSDPGVGSSPVDPVGICPATTRRPSEAGAGVTVLTVASGVVVRSERGRGTGCQGFHEPSMTKYGLSFS